MKRVLGLLLPAAVFAVTGFGQYAITTNGLPVATVNQNYSTNVQTNSFVPATACTIVSGSLPTGITSQPSGAGCLLSGTPGTAGTSNFAITVSNNQGQTTPAQSLFLQVFGITSSSPPGGSLGSSYSFQFQASGSGQFQWSLLSGSLPPGLLLNSNGLLSGVPQASGLYTFTVRVADGGLGLTDTRSFSVGVGGTGGQFQIIPGALPDAPVNQNYSASIQTTGGAGNLNSQNGCLVVQGSLPPGISMVPVGTSCVLSGAPSNQGTYQFQVRASDSQGQVTPVVAFSINVTGTGGPTSGQLTITTTSIPNGTTAAAYAPNGTTFTFTGSGGTGIYSWFVDSGSLPPGLSLGANGTLTGTPTQNGTFNFVIRLVSSGLLTSFQQTVTKSFSITIGSGGLTIVETSLPSAGTGQPYSFQLHGSGGTAPYHWRLGTTTLQGFSIDFNSGLISGSTQTAGTYSLPVTLSDANGAQTTVNYTLVVSTPFTILNTSLPDGLPGVGYNQTLQASGGQAPYSWTITSGSLPPGLTLSPSGGISGVPTVNGQYTITVLATDAALRSASKILTILIGPQGLVQIVTNTLPNGAVGTQYSQVVTASGGQLPYTWSINSGTLPPGLTLSSATGAIQGTPTQGGIFSFSIQAMDAIGNVASKPLGIVIGSSGFSVTPSQLSFSYFAGDPRPAAQQVNVSSNTNVVFGATSNSPWLSVSPTGGTTPASLSISVNPTGLAAGVYSGSVTVSPSGVSDSPQVISVVLTVGATSPFTVSSNTLTFTYQINAAVPSPQSLVVGSSAGTIGFNATASGGSWLAVNPTGGVTPATLNVSVNPQGLAIGTYNGAITIFGAGASRQVLVTLAVYSTPPPVLTLSKSSVAFTYQVGGGAPPPTQFVTLGAGSPLSFSASSGSPWLSVTPDVGTTPANLLLSVNPAGLAPGTYTGAIVITSTGAAGNTTLNLPVTLTITATAGFPVITTVVSAASYANGAVAPGEIVAIGGAAIGPITPASLTLDPNGKVATTLSGVQVLFNGFPAPLTYVSASQINAVVPYEIAGQLNLLVAVRFQGQTSAAYPVGLTTTAPGLFTLNAAGSGPAAILNRDNSTNSPNNPARKGDFIVLYLTGEGQTNPPGVTGKVTVVTPGLQLTPQPLLPVTVSIGGQQVAISFFGEAPGIVSGVMQINVQIPLTVSSGDLPVDVSVGGKHSQSGVTVSVQ